MPRCSLLSFLLSCLFFARAVGAARADEVKIIFMQYTPPYVFENGDGITDAQLRDEFERSMVTLHKSGRRDAIYRHYTEKYFAIRK